MIGKTILHYKIISKLGEGGMGVVYKAEDTKIRREVAIKFLPRQISASDVERERFKIEAQAAGALNHSNIATIYAIEESDDEIFIVMEYIKGRELKDRIDAGPLPIDNTLNLAIQIAQGLQAAHEEGVVHRDIKSANIMLTDRGEVKIMDFGLAKLGTDGRLTKSGTTIGTVSYMAPEQVRGESVDNRADIWSFGVVLYEMLIGKLPFEGDYEQAIMYAILNEPMTALRETRVDIPKTLESVVSKCLEKERKDRYQSVEEIGEAMGTLKQESDFSTFAAAQSGKRIYSATDHTGPKAILKWAAVFVVIVLLALIAYQQMFTGATKGPAMKMERLTSFPGQEADPSFSPDGQSVAFAWTGPDVGDSDIYIKLVDTGNPVQITDNPRHEDYPSWSPDGQHIAFVRSAPGPRDEIYVIPALGGTERMITTLRDKDDGGIGWSADGQYIYYSDEIESLGWRIFRVSVESSEIEEISHVPGGQENLLDYTPRASPDRRFLAFVRRSPATSADVYVLALEDREITRLTTDDLPVNGLAWTADSKEVVFNTNRDGAPGLWRVGRAGGTPEKIALSGMTLLYPTISTTGNRLAYYEDQINENIWRVNLDNPQIQEPIAMATQHKHFPAISPDLAHIAYSSDRTGSYEVWVCSIDGTGHNQLTRVNSPNHQFMSWSPDSKNIVFSALAMGIGNRLYVVSANGGKPRILTENAYMPGWSRDSKWVYFTNLQGMYKIAVDGTQEEQLIKTRSIFVGESWDGKYFYTSKGGPGRQLFQDLWRLAVDTGEEELIIKRDHYQFTFDSWGITQKGAYYVNWSENGDMSVNFYDFDSQKGEKLFDAPRGFRGHLDISSDEKWLIYLKQEQTESDLILIENFR